MSLSQPDFSLTAVIYKQYTVCIRHFLHLYSEMDTYTIGLYRVKLNTWFCTSCIVRVRAHTAYNTGNSSGMKSVEL